MAGFEGWLETEPKERIRLLEEALSDICDASDDPESGFNRHKPKWWDDYWSGFFMGAKYHAKKIYEHQADERDRSASNSGGAG